MASAAEWGRAERRPRLNVVEERAAARRRGRSSTAPRAQIVASSPSELELVRASLADRPAARSAHLPSSAPITFAWLVPCSNDDYVQVRSWRLRRSYAALAKPTR